MFRLVRFDLMFLKLMDLIRFYQNPKVDKAKVAKGSKWSKGCLLMHLDFSFPEILKYFPISILAPGSAKTGCL